MEIYVTRKGAVSARAGEWGIIPCKHGHVQLHRAGQGQPELLLFLLPRRRPAHVPGRNPAPLYQGGLQTAGVESRKDAAIVDEIPGAYKDIQAVIKAQEYWIEPVYQLKQLVCVKG